jgi:hypothetical protein
MLYPNVFKFFLREISKISPPPKKKKKTGEGHDMLKEDVQD